MSWFPVYIKNKPELEVFRNLLKNNYTVYLPLRRELVFGEDGFTSTVIPVIKGHMFIQASLNNVDHIKAVEKDLKFYSKQDKIISIGDGSIKFLKDLLKDDKTAVCQKNTEPGEKLLSFKSPDYGEIDLYSFINDEREYVSWNIKEMNKTFIFDLQGTFFKCLQIDMEYS